MTKPKKPKSVAAIHFGPSLLRRAVARATQLHGPRGLSRYVRQIVVKELAEFAFAPATHAGDPRPAA